MDTILNQYEAQGLTSCFAISRAGDIAVAQSAEEKKNELAQMAVIVFETLSAIGEIKIDKIEIIGDTRGLIMELGEESLLGSLFENREGVVVNELWSLLDNLKKRRGAPAEGPERRRQRLKASTLEQAKEIMHNYLGDFTERIYKNQLKSQRINADELYADDMRRLIATLSKAASMIIGPTKSREMRNKLLNLLR